MTQLHAIADSKHIIMIGTCLGLISAAIGAPIVAIFDIIPHIENEKGTRRGGKTSAFTKKASMNAPSMKNLHENTDTATITGFLATNNGRATSQEHPNMIMKLTLVFEFL